MVGSFVNEARFRLPGTGGVLRLDEIADGSVEVHAVAAEAVVGETALGVMDRVGEDLRVGDAVRAGAP